jgi:hypothetical protein
VSDLFLGIIAAAVVIMAIIQMAVMVFAVRAARQVNDAVSRFEKNVQPIVTNLQPIVTNLQSISSDAARASSMAAAQVERASQMMSDLARRVDDTAAAVQSSVIGPARQGYAIVQGILAALAAFRTPPSRKRPASAEEEDALFIG